MKHYHGMVILAAALTATLLLVITHNGHHVYVILRPLVAASLLTHIVSVPHGSHPCVRCLATFPVPVMDARTSCRCAGQEVKRTWRWIRESTTVVHACMVSPSPPTHTSFSLCVCAMHSACGTCAAHVCVSFYQCHLRSLHHPFDSCVRLCRRCHDVWPPPLEPRTSHLVPSAHGRVPQFCTLRVGVHPVRMLFVVCSGPWPHQWVTTCSSIQPPDRYWTIVGALYILLYAARSSHPTWLPVVLAVFVGSRGVVTLSVWLWTHDLKEVRVSVCLCVSLTRC